MKDLATYLYEMGQLKRVQRSGWLMIGVNDPESVAEHSFRAALIGYILAHLSGADPSRTALLCLFHDTPETRISDLHKTAKRYLPVKASEKAVVEEQVAPLPPVLAEGIRLLLHSYEEREEQEARLAHDADLLECLIQAREYQTQGFLYAQAWIDNCQGSLQTQVARDLAEACLHVEPGAWWQALNTMIEDR